MIIVRSGFGLEICPIILTDQSCLPRLKILSEHVGWNGVLSVTIEFRYVLTQTTGITPRMSFCLFVVFFNGLGVWSVFQKLYL